MRDSDGGGYNVIVLVGVLVKRLILVRYLFAGEENPIGFVL